MSNSPTQKRASTIFTLSRFLFLVMIFSQLGCSREKYEPSKITMRPRIFIEGAAPVPIIDEYDVGGVQIGSFADILSANEQDRVFGLWLSLDRRAAITLQRETARNPGRNLHLVIGGNVIGFHPVERTISNGIIPFLFTNKVTEEEAMSFYAQLKTSIEQIQVELRRQKD